MSQFYRDKLHETHASDFLHMPPEQHTLVRHQLVATLFLIRQEAEELKLARRHKALRACGKDIEHCLRLLHVLGLTPDIEEEEPTLEEQLAYEGYSGRPVKYTGLLAYLDMAAKKDSDREQELRALLQESYEFARFLRLVTKKHSYRSHLKKLEEKVKQSLTLAVSKRRLWWAWGRNLWSSVIKLFNQWSLTSEHAGNLQASLNTVGPVMGCFSWALFSLRAGVEIGESVREAMKQSAYSAAQDGDEKHSFLQFFGQQLWRRKFILMNDVLNGSVNAMVYFWLRDPQNVEPFSTQLGLIGGICILGVFVLEILLAVWQYLETQKKHHTLMRRLNEEEAQIKRALLTYVNEDQLDSLLQTIEQGDFINDTHIHYEQIMALVARWKSIKGERDKAEIEGGIQERKLLNVLVSRFAMTIGFVAMNAFYISGLPVLAELGMMIAGAGICFIGTIIFNCVNTAIDRSKLHASMDVKLQQARGLLDQFSQTESRCEQKSIYLQMRFILAKRANDLEWSTYHLKCLPLHTLIDVLVPVIFFMSLHFMALGPAIAVLASCVVLACAAKYLMKRLQPPMIHDDRFFPKEESERRDLDQELDAFIDNPKLTLDILGLTKNLGPKLRY
ncbi:MAG: hypothetical protein NTW08_07215 [Gammaproteobacteria bacterium]|nr:hypothetical protein [Gammaproteobacteria bacterium]